MLIKHYLNLSPLKDQSYPQLCSPIVLIVSPSAIVLCPRHLCGFSFTCQHLFPLAVGNEAWGLRMENRRLRNGQWVIEGGVGECRRRLAECIAVGHLQPGSDDRDNSMEEPACRPIESPQNLGHRSWETGILDLGQAEV